MRKPKVGDIARVVFLDHCDSDDEPCEFEVFGRILKSDKTSITLGSWIFTHERNRADDDNITCSCIVRSAIKSIEKLNTKKA
jgi:hypothetical protein